MVNPHAIHSEWQMVVLYCWIGEDSWRSSYEKRQRRPEACYIRWREAKAVSTPMNTLNENGNAKSLSVEGCRPMPALDLLLQNLLYSITLSSSGQRPAASRP